jgi:hypothetical protein
MIRKTISFCAVLCILLAGCGQPTPTPPPTQPEIVPTAAPTREPQPTSALEPTPQPEPPQGSLGFAWIQLGETNVENGLSLDSGGDADTEVVSVGTPPEEARQTGGGQALPSPDGNTGEDYFMQFFVDDSLIHAGAPTTRVRIEVEYYDQGTDGFRIQYDALSLGPHDDGRFVGTESVDKTDTQRFLTAVFVLPDAYMANRDNGADFRIEDAGDGPEIIRRVTVTLLPPSAIINVDSCGANPWDDAPDSEAIQRCVDQAVSGDTVTFTSGGGREGYQGYLIDKTIFLVATDTAKSDLTFTSTDPNAHAWLLATADLRGFVVRLYSRSRVHNPGEVDDITISHLVLDGGRDARICYGDDMIDDGVNDNWGSWLPECSSGGDPWCSPGTLAMEGFTDWDDATQDYEGHPSAWSTGIRVESVQSLNTECATALAFSGAAGVVRDSTVDVAGDHVHVIGCEATDPDEPLGGWADGITFTGPGHLIANNTILDASDVGIVFFGGKHTIITGNTIQAREGNRGMFAGIAIHPWIFGDVSGLQIIGNRVVNEGDSACGGIHAGINVGTHMWGGGCVERANSSAVGNVDLCTAEPPPPNGTLCTEDRLCTKWAHVAEGETLILAGNDVTGCHINYLIEGVDLEGSLVRGSNRSHSPRMTDWETAKSGCWADGQVETWGPLGRVAHHPSIEGWEDRRIHCER